MANLCFSYFPNHFNLKTTPLPPQQLQTSSSIFILQKRLLNTTHYSTSLHLLSAPTKSSSSLSCGLPLEAQVEEEEEEEEEALSPSLNFQLEQLNSQEHQSLLSLLRSFHFSDTHIAKLLIKHPRILKSDVHAILKPKLQFLADYGFAGPLLPDIIASNPEIFFRSLSNCIKPAIEFLEKYVHTNDKVVAAVKRYSRLLTCDFKGIMQPNIDFLLSEGVTDTTIARHMVRQPRTHMMKLDKIVNAVETVKELGLNPSAPTFLEAIRVKLSLSDSTWERKVQTFKSFGLSEEEIMYAFKRRPICFTCSEEKIRSLMDFYLNTMNLNPAIILRNPVFLNYRLSSRIRPRYNVIKVLESKKLLKEDGKHYWLLTFTEEKFLTTVVEKHLDQVPYLMELYLGTSTGDNIDIQLTDIRTHVENESCRNSV